MVTINVLVVQEVSYGFFGIEFLHLAERCLGESRTSCWAKYVRGSDHRGLRFGSWSKQILCRIWVSRATSDDGTVVEYGLGKFGRELLQLPLAALERRELLGHIRNLLI